MYQRARSKESKLSPLETLSSYNTNTNKYKFRQILNGMDRLSTLPAQNIKNNDMDVVKPYFYTYKGRCDIINCQCQYHRLKRPFGSQHISHKKKDIKQKHLYLNKQEKTSLITNLTNLNHNKKQRITIPSRLVKNRSIQRTEEFTNKQFIKKVKLRDKLDSWNEPFEQFLRTHDLEILKQRNSLNKKDKTNQSKQPPQNNIIKMLKNNLHKPFDEIKLILTQLGLNPNRIEYFMKIFEMMKSQLTKKNKKNKQNLKKIQQQGNKSSKTKSNKKNINKNIQDQFQQQKRNVIKNMEEKNDSKIMNIIKNLRKSDLDKLKLSLAEFIKSLISNNQHNQSQQSSLAMSEFLADFTKIIFGEKKKVRRVQSKIKNVFRTKEQDEQQQLPDPIIEQPYAIDNQQQDNQQKNYLRPDSQKTKAKGSDRSLLGSYRLSSRIDPSILSTSLHRVSVSSIGSSSEDLDHVRATKKIKKTCKLIKLQPNEDFPQQIDMINWQNQHQYEQQSEYETHPQVHILPKIQNSSEIVSKFHKYNNKRLATIFDLQIQRNRKLAKKVQKILRKCGFGKTIIQQYDSLVTIKRKIRVLKQLSQSPQFKQIQQQFEKYLHLVQQRYYFGKYRTIFGNKLTNFNTPKSTSKNENKQLQILILELKHDNELKHYFLKYIPLKYTAEQQEILLTFPSNLSYLLTQPKQKKTKNLQIPKLHQNKNQQVLLQKQLQGKLQEINQNIQYASSIYKTQNKRSIPLQISNCKDRKQSIKKCFRFTKYNYPDAFKGLLHLANNSKANSIFDMSIL